jgi:hypothetical protein
MATVKCRERECDNMVSDTAEVCPKCGAINPARSIDATIIFRRKSSFIDIFNKMIVKADGIEKGVLKNDNEIIFELPSGNHRIDAISSGGLPRPKGQMTIDLLPARTYRIEAEFIMEGIFHSIQFTSKIIQ